MVSNVVVEVHYPPVSVVEGKVQYHDTWVSTQVLPCGHGEDGGGVRMLPRSFAGVHHYLSMTLIRDYWIVGLPAWGGNASKDVDSVLFGVFACGSDPVKLWFLY